jgi:hypothetical protein
MRREAQPFLHLAPTYMIFPGATPARAAPQPGGTPQRARGRSFLPREVLVATARSVRRRALRMRSPARPIRSGARRWRIGGGGDR